MEQKINSELLYDGKVVKLYKDQVQLDEGHIQYREIVRHNGGVCIALKNDNHQYFLVRQYRYALNDYIYEFPAGKLEINENIEDAIRRESVEEVGYTIKNLKYHHYFIPTCGYCDEKIHLFSGETLSFVGQQLEVGEDLNLQLFTLDEIIDMIQNNQIIDAKTMILAYKLKNKG